MAIETLMQKWEVTEWRDGAVFKTKAVGTEWRPLGSPQRTTEGDTTYLYTAMSTSYAMDHQTIRRIKPNPEGD